MVYVSSILHTRRQAVFENFCSFFSGSLSALDNFRWLEQKIIKNVKNYWDNAIHNGLSEVFPDDVTAVNYFPTEKLTSEPQKTFHNFCQWLKSVWIVLSVPLDSLWWPKLEFSKHVSSHPENPFTLTENTLNKIWNKLTKQSYNKVWFYTFAAKDTKLYSVMQRTMLFLYHHIVRKLTFCLRYVDLASVL